MVNENNNLKSRYNDRNEPIEIIGDIVLNLNYWDCECDEDYIHPITKGHCVKCSATLEDSPNSRENEVSSYINYFLSE